MLLPCYLMSMAANKYLQRFDGTNTRHRTDHMHTPAVDRASEQSSKDMPAVNTVGKKETSTPGIG
jgi:hypothetical protein